MDVPYPEKLDGRTDRSRSPRRPEPDNQEPLPPAPAHPEVELPVNPQQADQDAFIQWREDANNYPPGHFWYRVETHGDVRLWCVNTGAHGWPGAWTLWWTWSPTWKCWHWDWMSFSQYADVMNIHY